MNYVRSEDANGNLAVEQGGTAAVCNLKVVKIINYRFGTDYDISWIPAVVFMFVAYSLNAGAYLTESIRAAILAIDKGQLEAALFHILLIPLSRPF